MATINISSSAPNILYDTIGTATAGDKIVLAAGTYTCNPGVGSGATRMMLFESGAWGASKSNIIIEGADQATVILDMSGCTADGIYGGDATDVTIRKLTITGLTGGSTFRDQAGSIYTRWTIEDISVGDLTNAGASSSVSATSFFASTGARLGVGLTIRRITTLAAFRSKHLIYIVGRNADLDLDIDGIYAETHAGTGGVVANSPVQTHIYLENVHRFKLNNVHAAYANERCVNIIHTSSVNVQDGLVTDLWLSYCVQPAIHIGNTAELVARTFRVHCRNVNVAHVSDGYGFEFENSCYDCSLIKGSVIDVQRYGVAIAECTERITVTDVYIDTVGNLNAGVPNTALSVGIIASTNRRHTIRRNYIKNCKYAFSIQHDDTQQNPNDGGICANVATPTWQHVIRDNVIEACAYVHKVSTNAMPWAKDNANEFGAGAAANLSAPRLRDMSHRLGPNVYTNLTGAYAEVDTVDKTQAQFEALFPDNIFSADVPVSSIQSAYSASDALNILAGADVAHQYTEEGAVNKMLGAPPHTYGFTVGLNMLIATGRFGG